MKIGDEINHPKEGRMIVAGVADIFQPYEDAVLLHLMPWHMADRASEEWVTTYSTRTGSEMWQGSYGSRYWTLKMFGERITRHADDRL